MNSIGKKPEVIYTDQDIDSFRRWELYNIIAENGWKDLHCDDLFFLDRYMESEIRPMIKSKMHEHEYEVNHGPRQAH